MFFSVIFGIIILYFQIFKAGDLSIWGVSPNLLIAYSAYLGAYQEEKWSLPLLFFLGLAYDLMSPETLGINTLLLLVICWTTNFLRKRIMEPKLISIAILSLLYNFFYYLIFGLYYSFQTEDISFLFITFILSMIINTVISVILFYFLFLLSHLKLTLR